MAIFSLYSASTFQVRSGQGLSSSFSQQRGVRQGCPLSPYLFVIVLSHIMHLTEAEYIDKFGSLPGVFSASTPLWDIEYADDTVIVTRTAETAVRFLKILIPLAFSKGLLINSSKCEHLRLNSTEDVNIIDPTLGSSSTVKVSRSVKYLGVILSSNSNSSLEVTRRISQANAGFKLLKPFLKHKSLPLKWRLSVYHQILRAILLYGLDSLSLDQTNLSRLDAFHFKVLRTCLGIKSSFFHKVVADTGVDCSNLSIHKTLCRLHLPEPTPTQLLQDSSLQLFGHILRHPEEVSHKVIFGNCNQTRTIRGTHRSGKPRMHWLENMLALTVKRLDIADNLNNGSLPSTGLLFHRYFSKNSQQDICDTLGPSIFDRIDITSIYRKVSQAAGSSQWHRISHSKKQ